MLRLDLRIPFRMIIMQKVEGRFFSYLPFSRLSVIMLVLMATQRHHIFNCQ